MLNIEIKNIIEYIENNIDISELFKINLDIDKYLDFRDDDFFDTNWIESYDSVEHIKDILSSEDINFINNLQKRKFMEIINITGSSDMASYLSDDFELFVFNLYGNFKNSWIEKLFENYSNGILYMS